MPKRLEKDAVEKTREKSLDNQSSSMRITKTRPKTALKKPFQ